MPANSFIEIDGNYLRVGQRQEREMFEKIDSDGKIITILWGSVFGKHAWIIASLDKEWF
jgi:hypothetical protein